jgi:hypothetical protein
MPTYPQWLEPSMEAWHALPEKVVEPKFQGLISNRDEEKVGVCHKRGVIL